ncbi:MAG: phenylalanine--tRNA ligase subunit beta [Bacteroidota bacterium]
MKISFNWLKQFLKLEWNAEKTAELLTNLGLEVESIEKFESIKGGLKGVVVGHVLECRKHPNADRLQLTKVDIGAPVAVQIVCGAPNVAVGQKVPVATIGTTLYSKDGEAWEIKKGKIRGEESHGMICAEDELGLGENHDGIMVLDNSLTPGTSVASLFEVENDEVFEIGLTPNRSDAMSHFGVARDLKAGLEQFEVFKELITPSTSHFSVDNRSLKIKVEVENKEKAPRYCGVTLKNVLVQESPDWLKNRLRAIGLSPINNVVDITNYVLHELGQPLHAFDARKIKGDTIEVKTLEKGTRFVTLDGVERELHEEDLMICDAEKPMCIAGVFGGIDSGVTQDTTSIFLESAYFDPISVRRTAKRHGLNTDASFRFERGIDINLTEYALKRAASLIKEVAGGEISSDIVDFYPVKKKDHQVLLTYEKINRLIGHEIPKDTIKRILAALEIKVNNVTETGLGVTIPSYRTDVEREVDVIEEILRVYGYDNVPVHPKFTASVAPSSKFENHKLQNIIGNLLAANGFFEILTNSLVEDNKNDDPNLSPKVRILNPLSSDLAAMRTSLLYTGLDCIRYNLNRKNNHLRLFEFGRTYTRKNAAYFEEEKLALFVLGNRHEEHWAVGKQASDFFYLKGILNSVLHRLGISGIREAPLTDPVFSEGLRFTYRDFVLAELGLIPETITKRWEIKGPVFYADLHWDNLLERLRDNQRILVDEIPKYPKVKRDFALLLDENITFQQIHDIAFETERKLLKEVTLFDVYVGKTLPPGKKSYAISFTLQDLNTTLTEQKINKVMTRLQRGYEEKLGAALR